MRAVYRRTPSTGFARRGRRSDLAETETEASTLRAGEVRCARCGRIFQFAADYSFDMQQRTVCRIKTNCFLPGGAK